MGIADHRRAEPLAELVGADGVVHDAFGEMAQARLGAASRVENPIDRLERRGETLPDSLRLQLLSGDWIPVGTAGRLRELRPDAALVSLGGATEAAIWSVLYEVDEVDPEWTSVPYGRAMRNQSCHVLDGDLDPRPVLVPGRLYIGGDGLARGYWRNEEKTAATIPRNRMATNGYASVVCRRANKRKKFPSRAAA